MPVPRTGSIEPHSGFGRATTEGQEIHQSIQKKRAKLDSTYEAEVPLTHEFEKDGYRFKIGGRIDGLYRREVPKIEEIKTTFNFHDLLQKLQDGQSTHPYCLQLKTYGYFFWLKNQVLPELSFVLVSSRNYEIKDVELKFNLEEYERWFDLRVEEVIRQVKLSQKRIERRKKIAENFAFPFAKPRPSQKELISSVEEGMSHHRQLLIQAPTGLGKTAGVLYPTLKEAMSRGQKVIYVTPKNSQHSVAEDAIERFQETGSPVKSMTITAKHKICFKSEPLCNPDYCEYAKGYYDKLHEHKITEELAKKKKLTAKVFKAMGEKYQVCPFELQIEATQEADTVICDYNYVFSPNGLLGKLNEIEVEKMGQPNLVIDEVHNLPSRAMDYYSPALSSAVLEKMRDEIRDLPAWFRKEAEELLDEAIEVIVSCRPEGQAASAKIDPPLDDFMEQDSKFRGFLSRYLDSDVNIQPRDVVLRLCFYWSEFTSKLDFAKDPERTEFFTAFSAHSTGGTVKITCCDPSEMLHSAYEDYDHVVGFSATLKPFDYYSKLCGFDPQKVKIFEFESPFSKLNRKVLIIPQISTTFVDRERNYPKIAQVVEKIADLKKGNYFVFFPSFDFLERVADHFKIPEGFTAIKQARDMKAEEVEGILTHLRDQVKPTLVFAVQGGVFSEGVDYPGNMIIGAFVVGPPLPQFNLEREEMKAYYQKNYGSGFEYAYVYPAMAKAIQSAGRVIRSEDDRGIIVLMDARFVNARYSQSMPQDWYSENVSELVSKSILKDVGEFWEPKAE